MSVLPRQNHFNYKCKSNTPRLVSLSIKLKISMESIQTSLLNRMTNKMIDRHLSSLKAMCIVIFIHPDCVLS